MRNATTWGSTGLAAAPGATLTPIPGEGVAVGVAVGRPVPDGVARALPDAVAETRVAEGGITEGVTAAGSVVPGVPPGTVPGCAQLGGPVGPVEAAALVGLAVVSDEAAAAGEAEAPGVTDGWPAGAAVAVPERPLNAFTAA